MHPITNYIKERIEELRREKAGLSDDKISEYVCIIHTIIELQAVLSKLEEQQLDYEFRETTTSLLKTLCIFCPDNVGTITVTTPKTLYTIDNLQELNK